MLRASSASCSRSTRRRGSSETVEAWAVALGEYETQDALAAVNASARTSKFLLSLAELIEATNRTRIGRLGERPALDGLIRLGISFGEWLDRFATAADRAIVRECSRRSRRSTGSRKAGSMREPEAILIVDGVVVDRRSRRSSCGYPSPDGFHRDPGRARGTPAAPRRPRSSRLPRGQLLAEPLDADRSAVAS